MPPHEAPTPNSLRSLVFGKFPQKAGGQITENPGNWTAVPDGPMSG
jgi:hypothetical protein